MNRSRASSLLATARRADGAESRLDRLGNPFAPSVQVFDALSNADGLIGLDGPDDARLRSRVARYLGVQEERLIFANGMDELIDMILLWRRNAGPVVLFPPTDDDQRRLVTRHAIEIIQHRRLSATDLDLGADPAQTRPAPLTAIVQSPNDPTGSLLAPADAVRLARTHEIVLIDERHGAYAARDLLRVAQEFDNVIVARSFETWAGLAGLPFAYAIAPKRVVAELQAFARPSGIAAGAAIAALATLDDLTYMQATVRRVREERTRLWRMLRKLNMLSVPYPTSANFVLARIERGDAAFFQRELARRGILVHRPSDPDLRENHLRISATTPEQTEALKRALIEIAAANLG